MSNLRVPQGDKLMTIHMDLIKLKTKIFLQENPKNEKEDGFLCNVLLNQKDFPFCAMLLT